MWKRDFVQTPTRSSRSSRIPTCRSSSSSPRGARKALNKRFALGWQAKGQWEEINLLSARDLRRLFPDATIHRERMLGLTKSIIAVRS